MHCQGIIMFRAMELPAAFMHHKTGRTGLQRVHFYIEMCKVTIY